MAQDPTTAALLDALQARVQTLESAVLTAPSHTDMAALTRQVQTLQGGVGNLEPLSAVSGWKLNTGFSNPMAPGASVFVGQGQMLLAGTNIRFSRPANSPYLQIDVANGFTCYDYFVTPDGSGTHTTIAAMYADFLTAALSATNVRKVALVCGEFTEQNIQMGTGASNDNTNTATLTIVGRGSALSTQGGSSTAYKSALIAHITGAGDAFFKTTNFNSPQIIFRNLRLASDDVTGATVHSFIAANPAVGSSFKPKIDCYDCRLGIGVATNTNGSFISQGGSASGDPPMHRFYNCSGVAGMLYTYGGGVQAGTLTLVDTALTVYQLFVDDNQALQGLTVRNCDLTTQNYLFNHTAGNQLSFAITGGTFRQNGSAQWVTYASGQIGGRAVMYFEGIEFTTADTTHSAVNVAASPFAGPHIFFMDSCMFAADNANSQTAVVVGGTNWLTNNIGNVSAPNYNKTASGTSTTLPSGITIPAGGGAVIGGSSATPTAGSIVDIISPQTPGAGLTLLLPRFPTSGRPAGVNGMIYYDSTLNRYVGFENSAWATLVTNEGEGLNYAVLAGRGSPAGNIFTGYASWGTAVGATGYSTAVQAIAGLMAYWRCGEASGNLADTASAPDNDTMVTHGTPTYSVAGAISGDANTAISLPGSIASYFEAPNSASLNVGDTFSIVAWIKKAANGSYMTILSQNDGGYDFRFNNVNQLELDKTFGAGIVDSTTTITDTNYHMVAVTKTGATVHLYIDNVDVTGAISNQTLASASITRIGLNAHSTGSNPWNGALDEVALWNVALSAANIATLYAAGTASAPAPASKLDGDITVQRISLHNTAIPVNSRIMHIETFTNLAANVWVLQPTFAPATNNKSGQALKVVAVMAPTANTNSSVLAVQGSVSSSGTFNLGQMIGLQYAAIHGSTGTVAVVTGVQAAVALQGTAGACTSGAIAAFLGSTSLDATIVSTQLSMKGISLSLAGGSATTTVTTVVGVELLATGLGNITSTDRKGISIPNFGTGIATNVLGIDIAAQTAGSGATAGIRNAAQIIFTPSAQQSIAVSAPIVVNASVVQVSTTTAANMTAAPTVANGQDGQFVTIVNTGANTFTLQDQGTLASSNLRLSAATIALATRDSIVLMYSTAVGDWIQVGQTNVL